MSRHLLCCHLLTKLPQIWTWLNRWPFPKVRVCVCVEKNGSKLKMRACMAWPLASMARSCNSSRTSRRSTFATMCMTRRHGIKTSTLSPASMHHLHYYCAGATGGAFATLDQTKPNTITLYRPSRSRSTGLLDIKATGYTIML